jgi:Recombination endonuclease VII
MTSANPELSLDIFYAMTAPADNGCLLWQGRLSSGVNGKTQYPLYNARNVIGGSVRSWVWRNVLGYDTAPRIRWGRQNRGVQCDVRCVSPEHLQRLLDYCANGHLITPGSPHYAAYPSNNERYCRTCKFDSFKKQKYGLTTSMENSAMRLQDGNCAICDNPLTRIFRDHNHVTGKFRGLLCPSCNTGLGMFMDDADIMKKAIAYIEDDGRSAEEYMSQYVVGE